MIDEGLATSRTTATRRPATTQALPVADSSGVRRMPWWPVPAMALAGAFLMRLAFPVPGWWWLLVPGLALVLGSATLVARPRTVLLTGLLSGLAFYLPLLSWTSLFLGWLPWVALGTVMAAGWGIGYVAIVWAYRWGRWAWPGRVGSWLLTPLVVAGLWTARDALTSSWPYGGFAWGRLAQVVAWSPLLEVVSWLGLAGTGFLLALLAAWSVRAVRILLDRGARPSRRALPLLAVALASIGLMAVPGYWVPTTGSIRVAGIQGGDERAGYFMGGQPGDVMAAHLRATQLLALDARPDVVVWPEGAAEWDPERHPQLEPQYDALVARYGAPLLLGSATERDGITYQSEYVWPSTGTERTIYDKRNPVPFGEYIPDRGFYEKLAPNLVGLIQRELLPGTGSPVLHLTTRDGAQAPVGVAICYDIIDDALGRESVRDGATWLVSPTNNADFGRTDELDQQLAFARLRAVETGRSLVQVSTVGHTAAFAPDGEVLAREPWYTPAAMVVDVPLSTVLTPAVRYGAALQAAGSTIGVLGLALAAVLARLRTEREIRRPGE